MILLTANAGADPRRCPAAVALFGAGMIGSAIANSLRQSADLNAVVLPLEWRRNDLFPGQLAAIESRISNELSDRSNSTRSTGGLQFIWCAGRAGFSATEGEIAGELDRFKQVLQSVERQAECHPGTTTTMVLMSSAGGLFEGQRGVGIDGIPAPRRPYSRLKLQQEKLLLNSPAPLTRKIYRLTSVYGYIRSQQRRGLIPTLIANGLRQRSSQITGFATTMRDYVWIEDVADYVSQALLNEESAGTDSLETLASGKPSSILEIQQIVEQSICRPLYVRYVPDATNGMAITFDASVLPRNWRPNELSTTVRKIVVDALTHQTAYLEAG